MWTVRSHFIYNSLSRRRHCKGIQKRMNSRGKSGGAGLMCAPKGCVTSFRYTHITDVMKGKHHGLCFLKKGFWFNILKRALHIKPKSDKGKEKWRWGFGKSKRHEIHNPAFSFSKEDTRVKTPLGESEYEQNEHDKELFGKDGQNNNASAVADVVKKTLRESEGDEFEKIFVEFEDKQNKQTLVVEAAAAAAAKAAVTAAQAAAMIARLTGSGYSTLLQESAAIRIQSVFRGYLARRSFRSLRGLMRLHILVNMQSVRRQATNTLLSGQEFVRIHSQIHSRRLRMAEQNQVHQRYLEQKHQKSLKNRTFNNEAEHQVEWDNSVFSKEEINTRVQNKTEASVKRERTLAYAFCHQLCRNTPKAGQTMLMEIDLDKPHWGWSLLERWMATRPWDNYHTIEEAHSVMKLQYVGQIGQQTSHIGLKKLNSEAADVGTSSKPFMLSYMSSDLKKHDLEVANGGISSNRSMLSNMSSWLKKSNSEEGSDFTSSNTSMLSNMSLRLKKFNLEMGHGATSSNPYMLNNEKAYSFRKMQFIGQNSQQTSHIGLKKRNSEVANGFTFSQPSMLSNMYSLEDDIKNNHSMLRSGRVGNSFHNSLASGSVIKDDESRTSSFRTPNYMASIKSTKAKVRSHSTPKQRPFAPPKETNLGPNYFTKEYMLPHRSLSPTIKLCAGPLKSGEPISAKLHSEPFNPGESISRKHISGQTKSGQPNMKSCLGPLKSEKPTSFSRDLSIESDRFLLSWGGRKAYR